MKTVVLIKITQPGIVGDLKIKDAMQQNQLSAIKTQQFTAVKHVSMKKIVEIMLQKVSNNVLPEKMLLVMSHHQKHPTATMIPQKMLANHVPKMLIVELQKKKHHGSVGKKKTHNVILQKLHSATKILQKIVATTVQLKKNVEELPKTQLIVSPLKITCAITLLPEDIVIANQL